MRRISVVLVLVLAALTLWRARSVHVPVERDAALATSASDAEPTELVLTVPEGPERAALVTPGDESVVEPASAPAKSSLSGIVRAPDGTPRRRAFVRYVWDDRGRKREVHGHTGDDGRFELALDDAGVTGDLLATVHHHELAPVARTGVHAGESGIELVLGAPAFLTIEARDPEERVLDSVDADFSFHLAGHPVDHGGGTLWRSPEPPRCGFPPVPFSVSVGAPWHRSARFGPFDPAETGQLLAVHLEPLARIRGRVVHRGEPVAKAGVSGVSEAPEPEFDLELARSKRRWGASGRTDEEGRFDLAIHGACRLELSAFALPFGRGKLAPIDFDGESNVDGLEIELTELPGSIEGKVTLPTGHRPEEISLSATGGHGYRPLRSDGTFVLPELPPGPCRIEIQWGVEPDWIHGTPGESWIAIIDGPTRPPDWLKVEPVYTVEVRPGERTHLDIDLSRPAPCRLVGEFLLGGRPPRLRPTRDILQDEAAITLDLGQDGGSVCATDLDERGRFRLEAESPGTYRLRAELRLEAGRWIVLDRVALGKDAASWRHDLPTGGLRVLPASAERPLWAVSPTLRWAGKGDLRIFVPYATLEEPLGSRLFPCVPAGRVELQVEQGEGRRTVLVCEVRQGKVLEVRWPE